MVRGLAQDHGLTQVGHFCVARDVKVDDGESHTRGAEEADDNLGDVEKTRERRIQKEIYLNTQKSCTDNDPLSIVLDDDERDVGHRRAGPPVGLGVSYPE